MDDTTPSPHNEFDIRVRTRIRDDDDVQPNPPALSLQGSIERVGNDPNIPAGAGGVMDMRTQAIGKDSATSVAAKGAFARAGDEDITIEFEYLFLDDPCDEAEIIVYLSDNPEVGKDLVKVARFGPPAPGRRGAIGSGEFAVFFGTFPKGDLNFTRGTYIELELRGRSSRCFIDNWDPDVSCYSCGDYNQSGLVLMDDYLVLVAEYGLINPGPDKGCLDLSKDKYVNIDDLLAWKIDDIMNLCNESAGDPLPRHHLHRGHGWCRDQRQLYGKLSCTASIHYLQGGGQFPNGPQKPLVDNTPIACVP